jgi:hypothetical protein
MVPAEALGERWAASSKASSKMTLIRGRRAVLSPEDILSR